MLEGDSEGEQALAGAERMEDSEKEPELWLRHWQTYKGDSDSDSNLEKKLTRERGYGVGQDGPPSQAVPVE